MSTAGTQFGALEKRMAGCRGCNTGMYGILHSSGEEEANWRDSHLEEHATSEMLKELGIRGLNACRETTFELGFETGIHLKWHPSDGSFWDCSCASLKVKRPRTRKATG